MKINLYQNDEKKKVWRRIGTAHVPKHTTSVKYGGCVVMMISACVDFNGTGSLVFIDDVTKVYTESKYIRSQYRVYTDLLSAQIQPNATKLTRRRFTVQMDNDPNHIGKATQTFWKAKKWNVLQWPIQSLDLNPIEHAFHLRQNLRQKDQQTSNN